MKFTQMAMDCSFITMMALKPCSTTLLGRILARSGRERVGTYLNLASNRPILVALTNF